MNEGEAALLSRIDHRALQAARAAPVRLSALARAVWWRTVVCGEFRFDVTETQLGPHEAFAVEELRLVGCPVATLAARERVYIQVGRDARSRGIFGAPSNHEVYGVLASFYCRVGNFHAPSEPFCISPALAARVTTLLAPAGYVVTTSPLPHTRDVAVYLVGIDDARGSRVRVALPRPLAVGRSPPRGTEFEWRY